MIEIRIPFEAGSCTTTLHFLYSSGISSQAHGCPAKDYIHLPASLAARDGPVTKFWPMGYKQNCVQFWVASFKERGGPWALPTLFPLPAGLNVGMDMPSWTTQ